MNADDSIDPNASIITRPRADFGVRITGHPIAVEGTIRMLDAYTRIKQERDALLAAAEAMLAAKENESETVGAWKEVRGAWNGLRRAIQIARTPD